MNPGPNPNPNPNPNPKPECSGAMDENANEAKKRHGPDAEARSKAEMSSESGECER